MLREIPASNRSEWMEVLACCYQHDFHHLPQYHRVAEQTGEGSARLITWNEGQYWIAIPLLFRPVDPAEPEGWCDATSVYGYAGPIASHRDIPESILRHFQSALHSRLSAQRIVAVFSRLHPLIDQQSILEGLGRCCRNGETLSIDLTLTESEHVANYSKSCRATLRKLRDAGFVGFHDQEKRYLAEFSRIYLATMHRVGASSSYCFDEQFFHLLTNELGDTTQLFVAMHEDRVAAASLITVCNGIVQDHLGGTADEYLRLSPDRLVVDSERRWAIDAGARVLHLGGGVGGQRDSLFRFKSGFSKRTHDFYTWRWIVNPDAYQELLARTSQGMFDHGLRQDPADYFPAYRRPAPAPSPAIASPAIVPD